MSVSSLERSIYLLYSHVADKRLSLYNRFLKHDIRFFDEEGMI